MLLASLLSAARLFCFIAGYIYTTMGNAIIMFFTWPIFATILSFIFLKEKVRLRTIALLILAFSGILVMYLNKGLSFTSNDFIGMTLMLFSAIIYAVTIVIFKQELKYYTTTETIFFQNVLGAIIFIPFIAINRPMPTLSQTGLGIIYAITAGMCTFYLFFSALKRLNVSHYSLLTYWEVPSAIFFGWLLFHEMITINIIIGGFLILISGFMLRHYETAS